MQPLLPLDARDEVLQVTTAQLHPSAQEQLVFSVSVLSCGGGTCGNHPSGGVFVLDFDYGTLNLAFGQLLQSPASVAVRGHAPNQEVDIVTSWNTASDPMCCPSRDYHQIVAYQGSGLRVVSDDRPWLGVALMDLGKSKNPRVISLETGSPASGVLTPGDQLLDIDGKTDSQELTLLGLPHVLSSYRPGDTVTLHFLRLGQTQSAEIKLGSWTQAEEFHPPEAFQQSTLGVQVTDGHAGQVSGAFVQSVVAGGTAATAGLTDGMLVVSVNGARMLSADDLDAQEFLIQSGTPVTFEYIDQMGAAGTGTAIALSTFSTAGNYVYYV
jgi:hypothetical protein